ncbi:MAG TPA: hypothetical protein DEO86_02140 [Colwellia sp.]|nr:hypothetical protein [Colwellia sp.]|tara:strand:- start:141 stop:380 length:240 start_codon:yes stop_codon:yes gene_type:complete
MALNNPKPKYVNGSLYPNAKMTVSKDMNPYAGKHVNEQKIVDVYTASMEGPKVTQNLGAGPKGQRSKAQIKKVPFKGLF